MHSAFLHPEAPQSMVHVPPVLHVHVSGQSTFPVAPLDAALLLLLCTLPAAPPAPPALLDAIAPPAPPEADVDDVPPLPAIPPLPDVTPLSPELPLDTVGAVYPHAAKTITTATQTMDLCIQLTIPHFSLLFGF
jgi:hypothetical protein